MGVFLVIHMACIPTHTDIYPNLYIGCLIYIQAKMSGEALHSHKTSCLFLSGIYKKLLSCHRSGTRGAVLFYNSGRINYLSAFL